MNIFVVDRDPVKAAKQLCDQHVFKMHTESVQMLVASLNAMGIEHGVLRKDGQPHKGGHPNHPNTKWVQESYANFRWLLQHACALAQEHFDRKGNMPHSRVQLDHITQFVDQVFEWYGESGELTEFPQSMPEEYQDADVVVAYRTFYIEDKSSFARWRYTNPPAWYSEAFDYAGVSEDLCCV